MVPTKWLVWTAAVVVLLAGVSEGQTLAKRSRIELQIGIGIQTSAANTVNSQGVTTDISAQGYLASIGYSYWLSESWAWTANAGVIGVDIATRSGFTEVSSRTAVVTPVLFGVRWYFVPATLEGPHRPYLSAAVGPVIGHEEEETVGTEIVQQSVTKSTVGSRLGAGLDMLLSKRFMLGVQGGYDLMADFEQPIGGRKNYSGAVFGISISLLLGHAE